MTKNLYFKLMLGVLLVLSVILSGCRTHYNTVSSLDRGQFQDINNLPAKDFVSLGMVFVEDKRITNGRGEPFIYQELLRQAHALGADTIINVVIDRVTQGEDTKLLGFPLRWLTRQDFVWYGTATAIRYVPGVLNQSVVVAGDDNNAQRTVTTPIMNRVGGSAVQGDDGRGGATRGGIGGFFSRLFGGGN